MNSNYKLDDFSEESWGSPAIARVTTGRGKAVTQLLMVRKEGLTSKYRDIIDVNVDFSTKMVFDH